MGPGIIAIRKDTSVWDNIRQQISYPKDLIVSSPRFLPMSIKPVDCDNALAKSVLAGALILQLAGCNS